MSNNCGCNGEHEHDNECECGCNHDEEMPTLDITLEDGTEMVCSVVGTYDVDEVSYIALVEENDDQVMIYRFEESEETTEEGKSLIDLINIEDDEEFDLASEAFFQLFVGEDEEEEEE